VFGSHLSIAGSMLNALDEAVKLKLDTVQVFTKNQQQWRAKPLDEGMVRDWNARLTELGWMDRTVSHASYLINLASPDDALWKKSIDLMCVEIERCEALSIPFLVHHPGAFTSSSREAGVGRIADAYTKLMGRTRGFKTVCCLENTVGAGSVMGREFEELALLRERIIENTGEADRVGFCFDTCHAHAGGYDMATRAGGEAVLAAFDRVCGLQHMRVVHVNDSIGDLDSRRDRHAHIGEGTIGGATKHATLARSGFAAVVNRPELREVPKVMETPKGETDAGTPFDTLNLKRLKRLKDGLER
jgi:deoxyribonuclease IV